MADVVFTIGVDLDQLQKDLKKAGKILSRFERKKRKTSK